MLGLLWVVALTLLAPVGGKPLLDAGVLQEQPAVASMTPPTPEDVQAARDFFRQARVTSGGAGGRPPTVTLPADTLQSVLRLGARMVPGYRATAEVTPDAVAVTVAVPVPWYDGPRWLNLHAAVAPFEGRIALTDVRLGDREIPPRLALRLARLASTFALGAGAGGGLLDAPAAMTIEGERIHLALRLDEGGRSGVIRGVLGALRGDGLPAPETVDRYYVELRAAMDRLVVPADGSFVPALRLAIEMAHARADPATAADEFTAAMIALAKACGAVDFRMVMGSAAGEAPAALGRWRTSCERLVLGGRVDLKRHFVTAAAIKAASSRGFAVSLGEFKELHDSISGAGGFDFTDIAANNSGIRLAALFLSRPHAEWPDLLGRMETDDDVLADLDGIPTLMPREAFDARFGDIDTPAYRAMLDAIEARIDATRLHRTHPAGRG